MYQSYLSVVSFGSIQWVCGRGVPRYEFSVYSSSGPSDSFSVTCLDGARCGFWYWLRRNLGREKDQSSCAGAILGEHFAQYGRGICLLSDLDGYGWRSAV